MLAREAMDGGDMSFSVPNYFDFRARQTSFSQFAAWRGLTANLTGIAEPRRLNVRHVTSVLLSTLGVKVMLGRDFTPDDDKFGVDRTAIVSYAFWQRELAEPIYWEAGAGVSRLISASIFARSSVMFRRRAIGSIAW